MSINLDRALDAVECMADHWVKMPVKASEEMVMRAIEVYELPPEIIHKIYETLIAAAPHRH